MVPPRGGLSLSRFSEDTRELIDTWPAFEHQREVVRAWYVVHLVPTGPFSTSQEQSFEIAMVIRSELEGDESSRT
jgi:hypothetical protein